MRFLTLAASLVLLTTPSAWCDEIPAFVPDMSYSRLFGAAAVHESVDVYAPTTAAPTSGPTPTSSPTWAAAYGFTTMNFVTFSVPNGLPSKLPYPPHTLSIPVIQPNGQPRPQPVPVQERFTSFQIFGNATRSLGTVPLSDPRKRTVGVSLPYNNTAFTSVSQFPKYGAGLLPTDKIDIFDDDFFGIMRLNGPNPTVIRKISTVSSTFGDLATLRSKYTKQDPFDSFLKAGQIYELDYAKLAILPSVLLNTVLPAPNSTILAYPNKPNPGPQPRYLASPYVLLQAVKENKVSKIVPIAIQLGQPYVAGKTAILYRADYKDKNGVAKAGVDQGDWNYAKTIVNAADATIHQLDAHLVKTHLVMENVIIGTHVKLGQSHPISRLIVGDNYSAGHSYKTLQINEDARNSLIPGIVDEVFSGGYGGAALLVNHWFASYNWVADYVLNDLSARGFSTPCQEDLYLYAKDAQDSWTYLKAFVNSVLTKYYPKDADVVADKAVQNWATYLSNATINDYPVNSTATSIPVPGFPKSFSTRDALVDAVTHAIYKSTVGHSVVNYPQTFYNAYIPIYPALALYRPILNATSVGTGLTTDAYIAAALGNANTQQVMTATANGLGQPVAASALPDDLTLWQYANATALAPTSTSDAVGVTIQKAAATLLTNLNNLSDKIRARDAGYAKNQPQYQYGYFDPKRVANAIFA